MTIEFDIDIDVADRDTILKYLPHRKATLLNNKPHNSGIYPTEIPHNPITMQATLDYKQATQRGYFKLDFLNVHIYEQIKSYEHYDQLLNKEPPWHKLKDFNFVKQLIHIGNYYNLIKDMDIDSIPKLAMFLAMIRPGKKHLIGRSWQEIEKEIWEPVPDQYTFKHSHSIGYAHLVILHMNLLDEH